MRRPRWSRWALLGGLAAALAAVPVAARPDAELNAAPLTLKVRYGDSLWTLARTYGDPDRDVREIVAAIMSANSVTPAQLQPGATLLIPAECLPRRPEDPSHAP